MFQFKRHHYCYKTRGDNQVLCHPQKLTFLKPEMNAENINENSLSFLRKSFNYKVFKATPFSITSVFYNSQV